MLTICKTSKIRTTYIIERSRNMFLHFILCFFTFHLSMAFEGAIITNTTTKPGCRTQCGSVTVPYPFGIGTDCSLNSTFNLTCNTNSEPPNLTFGDGSISIFNISESELRISTMVSYNCYDQNGLVDGNLTWVNLRPQQIFTFSEKNRFIVIGCDDFAWVTGSEDDDFNGGCFGLCSKPPNVPYGQCSGIGCCQLSIPSGLSFYNATLGAIYNHSNVLEFNKCSYGFLVEENTFMFNGSSDLNSSYLEFINKIKSTTRIVVDWVIAPGRNCTAEGNICTENSTCDDVDGGGYRCKCNNGYKGNPYLDQGCQDIDECLDGTNPCYGICSNTIGGYNCTCEPGYTGNAYELNGCKEDAKDTTSLSRILIIVLSCGMLALLCGLTVICFGIRKRKLIKMRETFFEQNGGLLLKQKIKSEGSHAAMTLFSTEQLRKATNNYSQEQIIGKGAHGVVYKGVLSDKRVVAIKKSKLVDSTEKEQFINEVSILTQVIHRNVVKLLGCCLEEEVPVLVYEFISNNTLYHHIHHRSDGMTWLSLENRLRIATEVASALGYLHSDIIMPIIHRDVKSANILLDENCTAKISDFGASRLVPLGHQEVPTLVQGTLGYLDPEYFNTSQLTDKSDVYSFGVVLAELLTGKKAIGVDRTNEEKNLATYFVKSLKGNRLFEIVEPRLLNEGTLDQLQAVGDLIKRCVSFVGDDRPTMKEVAVELEGLRKFTTHPWVQQESSNETTSLVLEVEHSDLYAIPLISEWDSYSGTTNMVLEENNPR